MIEPVVIVNGIFAVVIFVIIIKIINTNSKFNWAFGDDAKREELSFKFMRLLVVAILFGFIAAVLNIFVI